MANSDTQQALDSFEQVASRAFALKAQLVALGSQDISIAQSQSLSSLVELATRGQALLVSGARERREAKIRALGLEIQQLETDSVLGGDLQAINERIADLSATKASLLLAAIGDFSDVIAPNKVRALLELAAKVRDAAAQKKKAAQIVALVGDVLTSATEVAGAVSIVV